MPQAQLWGLSGERAACMPVRGERAPGVMRVAVLRNTAVGSGVGQYAIIQAVAPSLGVELRPIDMRDPGEIERAVVAFARVPNSGLIVVGSPSGDGSSKSDHHAKKVSIRPDQEFTDQYPAKMPADGRLRHG